MAVNPDDEKIPQMSEALAHGGHSDPNDVGNARFYLDKATGQYVWGWPTYHNNRQVGVRAAAPDMYTDPNQPNPANDPNKTFLRRQVQQTADAVTSGGASDSGGGGGGGNGAGLPRLLRNVAKAAPVAAALLNAPGSGGGPGSNGNMSPELQQLLAQALKRMSEQDGLFSAINAQAMAGLPTIYQR